MNVPDPIVVGSRLGRYEILSRVKSGGMATLYLARRLGAAGFRKHVAIKVVHDHLAEDESFVRMFVDEALLQARIQHPNVVHVEELGEHGGRHFLVMEYVHGCSLAAFLTGLASHKRRLTPELASCIAAQVLGGLHAAHELRDDEGKPLSVVHRDVSPQNVLLAYDGHVKLIDFGVAKSTARQSTRGASLKGKIRYMSPEQAFGHRVDRRTDVYAMGIVLWEMLTMRRLFAGDNELALLERVRAPDIRRPSELVDGVPDGVDEVVMRALEPDRDARWETARDMRRALVEVLPAALLTEALTLAELLGTVMQASIEKQDKQLPESMSVVMMSGGQLAVGSGGGAARAFDMHTVSDAGLGLDAYAVVPDEPHSDAPGTPSPPPVASASSAGAKPLPNPNPDEDESVIRVRGRTVSLEAELDPAPIPPPMAPPLAPRGPNAGAGRSRSTPLVSTRSGPPPPFGSSAPPPPLSAPPAPPPLAPPRVRAAPTPVVAPAPSSAAASEPPRSSSPEPAGTDPLTTEFAPQSSPPASRRTPRVPVIIPIALTAMLLGAALVLGISWAVDRPSAPSGGTQPVATPVPPEPIVEPQAEERTTAELPAAEVEPTGGEAQAAPPESTSTEPLEPATSEVETADPPRTSRRRRSRSRGRRRRATRTEPSGRRIPMSNEF